MCVGGSPKAPEIKEAPKADPRPTIEPSESSPSGQAESRKKRVQQYRTGFASTIKTSPLGIQDDQGKTKLGQ